MTQQTCPNCGAYMREGARFCGTCGQVLPTPAALPPTAPVARPVWAKPPPSPQIPMPGYPPWQAVGQPAAPPTAWNMELAGYGHRIAAYLIDTVLLYFAQLAVAMPVSLLAGSASEEAVMAVFCGTFLFSLAVNIWYFAFFQARTGQTLGKKLLGIQVIATDGGPPTRDKYLLRYFGYWVDGLILGIGYLMPLWDEDNQALHDKMADTYVIRV